MTTYNPYQGFDTPFYPGLAQPYDGCACGQPAACGTGHVATAFGKVYEAPHLQAFAAWDGALASNDLMPKKVKPYRPPALPFVCDRGGMGSTTCNAPGFKCGP